MWVKVVVSMGGNELVVAKGDVRQAFRQFRDFLATLGYDVVGMVLNGEGEASED